MQRLLWTTALLCALCLTPTAAQARSLIHPPPTHPGRVALTPAQSTNWSGYAAYGSTFTSVTGSWTVPAATCARRSTAYSSFWVGLDGYTSGSVEQMGTDSDCYYGRPNYYAWYELYPQPSYGIRGAAVSPGDVLTTTITSSSPTSYTVSLADTGPYHHWTASGPLTTGSPAARSSAEWVAEAPSSCSSTCTVLPLANFGTVSFTGAQATNTNPLTGPISSFTNDLITMVTGPGGTPKANPGPLTGGGSAFSVTWAHA